MSRWSLTAFTVNIGPRCERTKGARLAVGALSDAMPWFRLVDAQVADERNNETTHVIFTRIEEGA